MITKILELLENPLLSERFCKAIKENVERVLNNFSTDLTNQKDLLDQIIITINNQIRLEENAKVLESKLVQLVETERAIAVALQEMQESTCKWEEKKKEWELLTLGINSDKVIVEA